jgi:hypothetical protein
MISASPFGIEEMTYNEPDEIDRAMFSRYKGKANFKVG